MRKTKMLTAGAVLAGALFAAPLAQACQNADFTGNYSTLFTGFAGNATVAAEALLISNGAGGFSGQISYSRNGVIHSAVSLSGTWSFNVNCTGAGQITGSPLGTINFDFTLTPNGKQLNGLETDGGTAVTITGKR